MAERYVGMGRCRMKTEGVVSQIRERGRPISLAVGFNGVYTAKGLLWPPAAPFECLTADL